MTTPPPGEDAELAWRVLLARSAPAVKRAREEVASLAELLPYARLLTQTERAGFTRDLRATEALERLELARAVSSPIARKVRPMSSTSIALPVRYVAIDPEPSASGSDPSLITERSASAAAIEAPADPVTAERLRIIALAEETARCYPWGAAEPAALREFARRLRAEK